MSTHPRFLFILITTLALILTACGAPDQGTTPAPTSISPVSSPLPDLGLPALEYGPHSWIILSVEACSNFKHSEETSVEGQFIQIMLECTSGAQIRIVMDQYGDRYMNSITLTDSQGKLYPTFGIRSDGTNVCNRTVLLYNNVPDEPGLILQFLDQPAVQLPKPTHTIDCTPP